jgi:hypothetical protein
MAVVLREHDRESFQCRRVLEGFDLAHAESGEPFGEARHARTHSANAAATVASDGSGSGVGTATTAPVSNT